MNERDLAFAGLARQAELVRAGEVSSRELVELYLERIFRLDTRLNAYRVVLAERALGDADQADARRAAGAERPLLGVPIALKDNVDLAGEVTANGSVAHGGPARDDAEVVKRLRSAGAVVLGKTHLPELAIMGVTESSAFGVTRNPWSLDRSPGGSSGGSAAAVAAGLAAAGSASDGAGSIRIPAAACGLFGLKPQRGRISLAPHSEHWQGMTVLGGVTRTVLDTALFLDVVTEQRPERPFLESARSVPGRLRVAVSVKPPTPVLIDDRVRRAVHDTADLLRSLGHQVVERDPAYGNIGSNTIPRYLLGIRDEARSMAHPERLSRRTRGFARLGAAFPDALMARVRAEEPEHVARLGQLFEDNDVLLTPVAAQLPIELGRWEGLGALRTLVGMYAAFPYSGTWNATGQPAASVPVGFSGGLPLSVQLVGRPGDEATLLSLAAQIESEQPEAQSRPPVS
jgi:amidase